MQDIEASDLTDKQRKFIETYLSNGFRVGEAALAAGYSDESQGSKALRNRSVIKEINKHITDGFAHGAAIAQSTLMRLMQHGKSDYVKLEAARDWLDRAGYRPPERVDHRVDHDLRVSINLGPVIDVTPKEGGSKNGE